MGLFNHVFEGKKGRAKELDSDASKLHHLTLARKHAADISKKSDLARQFNFGNVDKSLQDWSGLLATLEKIEGYISEELVDIKDEEKLDEELIGDLEWLASEESRAESENLNRDLAMELDKQRPLLKLLKKLHAVLKAELHLIKKVRHRPGNARDLLLHLFTLIFQHEVLLYRAFKPESFYDDDVCGEIHKIVRVILFQEELKEDLRTAEKKFVHDMVRTMGHQESNHHYRKLGEAIYEELAEQAGAPMRSGADLTKGIAKLEWLMKDDAVLSAIVRKLRPRYDGEKIGWTMTAFRKAYDLGHFTDMEAIFAT